MEQYCATPENIACVALIGKYHSPEIAESLRVIADFLRARGVKVLIEAETAAHVGHHGGVVSDYDGIGRDADVAVVVGGDGTLLNAARHLARNGVPLVGVNQGRLGFMTDIALRDMLPSLQDLLDGRFSGERRIMLEVEVLRQGAMVHENLALNDIVLSKGSVVRMIEFELKIDGEFIYAQRSDGLIVATPTGSTAYALSANGPILHPAVAGMAVVPLCPHALSNRPITVSDDCRVEIVLLNGIDARVHCDGQESFGLLQGDVVRIGRSRHGLCLLHPPGYNYYAMLREKLRWSEPPRAN